MTDSIKPYLRLMAVAQVATNYTRALRLLIDTLEWVTEKADEETRVEIRDALREARRIVANTPLLDDVVAEIQAEATA